MWAFGAKDGASRHWFEIFEMSSKGRQLWWFCTVVDRHLEAFLQPAITNMAWTTPLQLASKYRMHPICTGVWPMLLPHEKDNSINRHLNNCLHGTVTRHNVKNMTCKWKSRYACEKWCTHTLGICKQVGLKNWKGPTIQSQHPMRIRESRIFDSVGRIAL